MNHAKDELDQLLNRNRALNMALNMRPANQMCPQITDKYFCLLSVFRQVCFCLYVVKEKELELWDASGVTL